MNLKNISDTNLLVAVQDFVKKERASTSAILFHFQGIERRRLHLERGYSSLHEFAVKFLKYSDGAAHRRIAAARLLKQLPELKVKIESGAVSLSVAAQAQDFFRAEKIDDNFRKAEIVETLENKTLREAQKELFKISPTAIPRERERQLTENQIELKIVIDERLRKKLEYLRCRLSQNRNNMNYAELIEVMADMTTKKLEKPPKRASAQKLFAPQVSQKLSQPRTAARRPGKNLQFAIRTRDENQCAYTDPITQRRCGSRYRLEYDHIVAHALGGETTTDNLRLLCRAHNHFMAVKTFGLKKIEQSIDNRTLK